MPPLIRSAVRIADLAASKQDAATIWYELARGFAEMRIARLRRAELRNIPILVNGRRHVMRVRRNGMDQFTFYEVFVKAIYDSCLPLPDGSVVLDLGANIGFASVFFAARANDVRVIAVEPEPDNFRLLSTNVGRLNVETCEAAISSSSGEIDLELGGPTGHRLSYGVEQQAPRDRHKVLTLSLDELASRFRITAVDLLKMDIEGEEYPVLTQECELLQRTAQILVEIHDERNRPVIARALKRVGFAHERRNRPYLPDHFVRE